ncbi:MAG: malate dehydrogenase [Candidatus Woesearchaeota archaeon]
MNKITIVGAGGVGAQTAFYAGLNDLGEIVLVDVVEGLAQGRALDIQQAMALAGSDAKLIGTNDYSLTKDSDIIVITAGLARKPGMSRDDLREINMKIVTEVVKRSVEQSPDAIIIVVTNPLDAMVKLAYKVSGFPKQRVIGMAGVLDSARFKSFLAQESGASVRDVEAMVLGGHGDTMVPLAEHCRIKGKPARDVLSEEKVCEIVERVKNGGAEIVGMLKTGSAIFAPALSVVTMIGSILLDKKQVLPCSVLLEGEYGTHDLFIGVPAVLGRKGVEDIIEFKSAENEREAFRRSVEHISHLVENI